MAIANRIVQERPVLFRQNMQVISSKEIVGAYARVSTETDTNLQLCYADISIQ